MTAFGPTLLGGAASNNTLSLSFRPSVPVATASMLWVVGITTVVDTAVLDFSDQAGNSYLLQIFNMPSGSSVGLFAAWSLLANPISTIQNIAVASSIRGPFAACAVAYGGVAASIHGVASAWFNSIHPVLSLPSTNPGDQLLGMLVVGGPNTDQFTQSPGFSADIGGGLGNANFSLHGGGSSSPNGGAATYEPVLGALRQSMGFLASFA